MTGPTTGKISSQANDLQIVSVGGHDRWHNRDAVTGLRERQQSVGSATFERDVWLELGDAARCVKRRSHGEAAVEKEKGMRREVPNVHPCVIREPESTIPGCDKLQWREPNCFE